MSIPTKTREYSLGQDGDYKTLAIREATLESVKSNEVLVKIHAVSLQYRDVMLARQKYTPPNGLGGPVPCSDMAGEIVSVGSDVKEWAVGDRVTANMVLNFLHGDPDPETLKTVLGDGKLVPGVLTEYRTFPSHSLVAIPDFLSYEEASTLPCAGITAYNALNGPKPVKAGDTVLIMGTGGVSIFGLQFALAAGATVIVTSSSDEKLEIVKGLGAHHTINYKTSENWDEDVLKITNGRGVDHIVEVGGPGTLATSIKALHMGGSIHLIGGLSSDTQSNPYFSIVMKSAIVRGILVGPVDMFKDMIRLIIANPKVAKPIVDKVFPFEEAVEAYAHLESQKHLGKVVIKVA